LVKLLLELCLQYTRTGSIYDTHSGAIGEHVVLLEGQCGSLFPSTGNATGQIGRSKSPSSVREHVRCKLLIILFTLYGLSQRSVPFGGFMTINAQTRIFFAPVVGSGFGASVRKFPR
jgi:hypothetical protein